MRPEHVVADLRRRMLVIDMFVARQEAVECIRLRLVDEHFVDGVDVVPPESARK